MTKFLIQWNEARLDLLKEYIKNGYCNNFDKLLDDSTIKNTSSDADIKRLEPWIQWYSFYSGEKASESKVFHLTDALHINEDNLVHKASKEKSIAVFGSMNLRFKKTFKLFIPDPWSDQDTIGNYFDKKISYTIKNLILNNSKMLINLNSLYGLLFLIMYSIGSIQVKDYFKIIFSFLRKDKPALTAYFDLLFFIYSHKRVKKIRPDICFTFLNGTAHIQHHYLLSSPHILGNNPKWYVEAKKDPLLEHFLILDKLAKYIIDNNINYEIVTALGQSELKEPSFYYRLDDHQKVLDKYLKPANSMIDISITPLMSRDFIVQCKDTLSGDLKKYLSNIKIKTKDGIFHPVFGKYDELESNRLFVSVTIPFEIMDEHKIFYIKNSDEFEIGSKSDFVFVAIKNSGHSSKGYWISNTNTSTTSTNIDIKNVFNIINS